VGEPKRTIFENLLNGAEVYPYPHHSRADLFSPANIIKYKLHIDNKQKLIYIMVYKNFCISNLRYVANQFAEEVNKESFHEPE